MPMIVRIDSVSDPYMLFTDQDPGFFSNTDKDPCPDPDPCKKNTYLQKP